ncbi:MAG: hypothetical protein V1745_02835, partial [Patescibacteria group bacterium]
LLTIFGVGCLPGRGTGATPEMPTPSVVSTSETPTEPVDPIDAEAFDDATLTEEEDVQMNDLDRAGALHEADVGSLEDAFAEESNDDARTID